MNKPSHTLLAAAALLSATSLPSAALVTMSGDVGSLRDASGSVIANTATLWAIIYDDDGDGLLPGGLSTNESLIAGDAAATWSVFKGKTISDGTMIGGDRIIAVGEFNDPDGVAFYNLPDIDLAAEGLVSGRPYGLYWFPGRTLASNQIPASGSFPVGGINEVNNFDGTLGTEIPPNGNNEVTGLLDTLLEGTLPTTRFHAITAEGGAGFADWIAGFPAVGSEDGFHDDPDGDGLDNGVESALGTRPDTKTPGITVLSATGGLSVQSSKAKPALADVTATWQWSDNLVDWYGHGDSNGSATVTINETVTDPSDPNFDVTQVDAEVTVGTLGRLFLRLSASQSP